MKYFLTTLLFLSLLYSCGSLSLSGPENKKLEVSLVLMDKFKRPSNSFVQGEQIEFFLVLTNNSTSTKILNFSSGQQYDFYVKSLDGAERWRWSEDKLFIQATTELKIQASKAVSVREIWNQQLKNDQLLPAGSYSAVGSFLEQSEPARVNFTIQ